MLSFESNQYRPCNKRIGNLRKFVELFCFEAKKKETDGVRCCQKAKHSIHQCFFLRGLTGKWWKWWKWYWKRASENYMFSRSFFRTTCKLNVSVGVLMIHTFPSLDTKEMHEKRMEGRWKKRKLHVPNPNRVLLLAGLTANFFVLIFNWFFWNDNRPGVLTSSFLLAIMHFSIRPKHARRKTFD